MAPWAKAALEIPVRIASRVHPTAYTLPNGLRIMVQRVDTNPTVFINGSIDLSPSFDPIGKTGTGALASALLGYGGAKYDFDAERRIPDELGDDVSYGSNFRAHGLVGDLDRLLDLLADTVTAPTFPQQYVDLVSSQERATITQRDRDPETKAGIAFAKALYAPGDPALRVETLNDLGAITRNDIVRYAQRYFRPDRATIVIAGDVDPTVVRDAVALHFGSWTNNGPRPTSKLPDIPATIASRQIIPAQRDEIGVRMGERGIARSNPDFYALNLVNEVLGAGGTFDTRLMSEIRAKRGLVYGVSSQLAAGRERGLFEIAFNAAPQNVPAAVAGVKAEVRRMTTTPVSATEWNRARTKLLASTVVSEESTAAIVARAENIAQNHLPTDYYATIAQRYGKLTPADGLRAAKRHLNAATFAEVYVGTLPASTASSTTHHASH
jgi:zinc protease